MQKIVEIKFGSHLYGTATAESDLDIKAIYLPEAKDILLQRVRPVISESRVKTHGEKNTSEDVDIELYSPEKFLKLLAEGQTVALDMLFAPGNMMISKPSPVWEDIQKLAKQIVNKRAASFVRYCRQQANKYGIKGSRVAAARMALDMLNQALENHKPSTKLIAIEDDIKRLVATNEFLAIQEIPSLDGSLASYFEVCGKKAAFTASIKSAQAIIQRLVEEYGARAIAAEKNAGVDWKALSHAVRVGHQAIEFLSNHRITFPRPEAQHLVNIKTGQLLFKEVAEEIEALLEKVEAAALASTLKENCDMQLIDNFIEVLYRKIILADGKL